jgi:hypothetical protein
MYIHAGFAKSLAMSSSASPRPTGLPRFVFVLLCVIWAGLVLWANVHLTRLQAENRVRNLPFGVFSLPDGTIVTQDFAYNLLFLKGVRDRLTAHPYRLDDQVQMMRRILPQSQGGMSHAYSPVALVLALPLLSLSGHNAYLIYTILSAAGILLLYYFCLMPLMETRLQIYAFLACILSVTVVSTIAIGQSALITTTLLGALWCLLKRRPAAGSVWSDLAIATLFWALCLKPNLALIPFALLLGEKAWRPLAMTALMLAATWIGVAEYYGGWWSGLSDYFYLLNHYNNADFPPYLQRGAETPGHAQLVLLLFSFYRALVLALSAVLLVLRWTRHITPSQLFQGMVWVFLLFSPYLMGSEPCILCLLVVEGSFFRSNKPAAVAAKLLLLAAILDLRTGVTFPVEVALYLKWLLFCWIVAEGLQRSFAAKPPAPCERPPTVAANQLPGEPARIAPRPVLSSNRGQSRSESPVR